MFLSCLGLHSPHFQISLPLGVSIDCFVPMTPSDIFSSEVTHKNELHPLTIPIDFGFSRKTSFECTKILHFLFFLSFNELHLMATPSPSAARESNCLRWFSRVPRVLRVLSQLSLQQEGASGFLTCWFRVIPPQLTSFLGTEKTQRENQCFDLNTLQSTTSLCTCSRLHLSGAGAIRLFPVSVRQANSRENDEVKGPGQQPLAALLYNPEVMQRCPEKTPCSGHAFPEGNTERQVIMAH